MKPAPRKAKAKAASKQSQMVDLPPKGKTTFERVFYGDELSNSSSEDSDFSEYDARKKRRAQGKKGGKTKKRKVSLIRRSPTPQASEMSDIEDQTMHEDDHTFSQPSGNIETNLAKKGSVIPALHLEIRGGANTVHIDLAKILNENPKHGMQDAESLDGSTLLDIPVVALTPTPERKLAQDGNKDVANSIKLDKDNLCFLDIEPDLRNRIYRLVLVAEDTIQFSPAQGTARSSALLRTCHQVHLEASSILYGENTFHFARVNSRRGTYLEKEWKEVGYKDIRRFLEEIGPNNRAHIKYISLEFSDATTYMTPYMDHAERKYVNDPLVLRILNLIASTGTVLHKFVVGFTGRQTVGLTDFHFLKALTAIRCRELTNTSSFGNSKVQLALLDKMKEVMEIPWPEDTDKKKKKRTAKMLHEKPNLQTFNRFD